MELELMNLCWARLWMKKLNSVAMELRLAAMLLQQEESERVRWFING